MWGAYVHMCTKYEDSVSNPVPGGGVHRCQHRHRMMMHDGQSMTVQDSLVDKPNEPKNLRCIDSNGRRPFRTVLR